MHTYYFERIVYVWEFIQYLEKNISFDIFLPISYDIDIDFKP